MTNGPGQEDKKPEAEIEEANYEPLTVRRSWIIQFMLIIL